jgi:8-oxo-dGTP pyrophosphatase MutT (NUDIX family)
MSWAANVDRPVEARMAATTVLLRDRDGVEVLMLRRGAGSGFAAKKWVFPGGAVDAADRRPTASVYRFDAVGRRAARLRASTDLLVGWHFAAVRETFEESGILLAATGVPDLSASNDRRAVRRDLVQGRLGASGFSRWLAASGTVVDLSALVPFRRWVTPRAAPRRFDTLFLLAVAPPDQAAAADGEETTEARWLRPATALEDAANGKLDLVRPTLRTLEFLAGAGSVAAVFDTVRTDEPIPPILPHAIADGPGAPALLEPDDAGYPVAPFAEEYAEWV